MNKKYYRLYVNTKQYYFKTFEEAQQDAKKYMSKEPELRIEILKDTSGADFWAYEYKSKEWVPS
jgi:hypothetical protein